ncbi:MAG: sulfotransferase [Acidobacteriota bacterium]
MTLESIRRPLAARVLNLGDRALRAAGIRRDRLTPEVAKADAAAATGLDDFGPEDFEEGLAVFCRSVEAEAGIDIVGRAVLRAFLRRILSNRLLLVDHRKNGVKDSELITPPIIVLGLPRTGTTFLHRLLAQDPHAYGPPAWQVWRPLPRPTGIDRRREITKRALEDARKLSPFLDSKHHMEADETEECYHLLDPSFRSCGLSMICHARGYFDWVRKQDIGPAYKMYHEYLRIIQQSAPAKRLTLKTPLHTPYMEEITVEIPGVRFVQTHRNLGQVAGSFASLCYSMFAVTSPYLDANAIGEVAVDLMRWMAQRSIEQRARCNLAVVDVQYTDLVTDPVATVRRVYEEHGLEWTPAIEAAVSGGAEQRPQHKQGKHRYQLSDFGLTEAGVRAALGEYAELY